MLITIGAFDGFHKGHAKLFEICRNNAVNDDWAVFTFWPHPSEFFHRIKHPLFTLQEREIIRRIIGVPKMFVLKFDDALKDLQPVEFWKLLRERFFIDGLVMGSDFHFGHDRTGSAEFLASLAKSDGLKKIIIAELLNKKNFSSSIAREKILLGKIQDAKKILGYPFFMVSSVIHGNERGRKMNFPTANLNLENRIIPADGVYSVAVLVNEKFYCGALSIGNNPTFKDVHEKRAEVFILDFHENIYGDDLPVFFLERVRDVKTFENQSQLINQIERDIITCRKIFEENITQNFFPRVKEIYSSNFIPEIIELV